MFVLIFDALIFASWFRLRVVYFSCFQFCLWFSILNSRRGGLRLYNRLILFLLIVNWCYRLRCWSDHLFRGSLGFHLLLSRWLFLLLITAIIFLDYKHIYIVIGSESCIEIVKESTLKLRLIIFRFLSLLCILARGNLVL